MAWCSSVGVSASSWPGLGGTIKDWTGKLDYAFYLSAVVLIIAVVLSWVTKRPLLEHEK